ncbi:unnamed protein product [Callosobruchus maculatus]|uniref:Fatty acid hydroxylase domain-containing protein n=1 Tax=Callosobruchus maculatus TaxID=64391 RepID=A0A653CYW6_CALMS|nr:unnamed protein product [Callosobruchus maculatus]
MGSGSPQNGNGGVRFDPMAVTWTEKYDAKISKVWNKLPDTLGKCIATIATFMVGISINGDWLGIMVHMAKQLGYFNSTSPATSFRWTDLSLESFRMKNLFYFWFTSCLISYVLYFGIGGFIHWYYYVRQRDRASEWKCQPNKWLSPDLERHEILLGSCTLFCNASVSAIVSCYLANGGYSRVYYDVSEYGWPWLVFSTIVFFIYQDYATYWLHRIYHLPFLYKHFHKLHHKYKHPTAFSVTAIHPVESIHIQSTLIAPLFFFPMHWAAFYTVAMYVYYHGIIDHSGVNFKAYWWQPWQPDAIFHDNHHQYFHVNFSFNIVWWDRLHGTYRRKDRVYREDIYYGQGKSLAEVTAKEIKEDLEERRSENPLAYRQNKLEFQLTEQEVANIQSNATRSGRTLSD